MLIILNGNEIQYRDIFNLKNAAYYLIKNAS
jgi:hypothetical protein